jgi:hypothetical protein
VLTKDENSERRELIHKGSDLVLVWPGRDMGLSAYEGW